MTTAFDQVTIDTRCIAGECEKQGCAVDLAGTPRPVWLIDMDHPRSPAAGARCDYLFIGTANAKKVDLDVVALELKSSRFRAAGVSKQLKGGAKAAEKVVPKVRCRFVPVVAHAGARGWQIRELAKPKHHVRFRGKQYLIRTLRCGDGLSEVLQAIASSAWR